MKFFEPDPSRYEFVKNAGDGLNASVFKAVRIDGRGLSRQDVALKFLKDRTAISFMRREFETLSKVKSAHCAHVLGWESRGDDFALVLEWVDGPTLYDLANAFNLSREIAQEISAQIYQGLLDLRASGLHHGDLHPKNVMLDSNGTVRLIDFATGRVSERVIQGAPAFLAPEIWKGDPTSFEADLFALGVMETSFDTGFRKLSERAESSEKGWTAKNPSKRLEKAPALRSSQKCAHAQGELKNLILSYMREKNPASTQQLVLTPTFLPTSPWKSSRFLTAAASVASVAVWLIAVSTLAVPVRAEAPLATQEIRSRFKVQSQNWLEVSLNGRKLGFAPLSINGLRPGPHKLRWKSAFGSGDFAFKISPGETYSISESELRSRAAHSTVKR